MKLLIFLLLALEALPLPTSALPLPPARNQQAIAIPPPRTPPSPITSFSSTSDLDSRPPSDRSAPKFSLATALRKIRPSSPEFRCRRYPQNSILAELSAYVTDLLRRYRETVFGGPRDRERLVFETCYAGYESSDVSPSIYFGNMKAKQVEYVERLLRNQLPVKFPGVEIRKTSSAIAVVMKDELTVKRRDTV